MGVTGHSSQIHPFVPSLVSPLSSLRLSMDTGRARVTPRHFPDTMPGEPWFKGCQETTNQIVVLLLSAIIISMSLVMLYSRSMGLQRLEGRKIRRSQVTGLGQELNSTTWHGNRHDKSGRFVSTLHCCGPKSAEQQDMYVYFLSIVVIAFFR